MTSPDAVQKMLRQVWQMPYGAAQIAAAEECVRHADALADPRLAFDARLAVTNAYQMGGEPAKVFVPFSWCLAEHDRDPARYGPDETHQLLWYFKYAVSSLTRFPDVPLDRTFTVLDDMQRRYQAGGHSMHAVYQHRWLVAHHLGDAAAADEWYGHWCIAPRDELSDCAGCDPTGKVTHLAGRGRDEEAVALAMPVLTGRLGCVEQPQSILTALLLPYLRTGRLDEARDAHRRAYLALRDHPADLDSIGEHLRFCALTGNEARGLEIIERHLHWLDRAPSPYAEMRFAAAAALVLNRLIEQGHVTAPVRRLASSTQPAGEIEMSALREDLAGRATALAARFDARNRSDHQSRRVSSLLAATPIVDYLPLSATARRRHEQPGAATQPVLVERSATPVSDPEPPTRADLGMPDQAGPAQVLDLAEEAYFRGDTVRARAICELFDAGIDAEEVTALQRARRTDLAGGFATSDGRDHAAAERAWTAAIESYERLGEVERWHAARSRLSVVLCETGRVEQGLTLAREAAEYLTGKGAPHLRAGAVYRLGGALLAAGRPEEALVEVERAAEFAGDSQDPALPHALHLGRARCLGVLGRIDDSMAAARLAAEGFEAIGDRRGQAAAAWALGLGQEVTGDLAAALASYESAIAHMEDGELAFEARVRRAHLLARSPRAAEAIDDLVEAVARAAERGEETGINLRLDLAVAYANAGRLLDAAEAGEEAVAMLDTRGEQHLADHARYMLATIYRDMGEADTSLSLFDLLAANLDGFDNAAQRGRAREAAAELRYHLDRDAEAATGYEAAAGDYRLAGQLLEEVRARRMAALSLRWAGEPEQALAQLADADALATRLDPETQGPAAAREQAMLGLDGAKVLLGADRLAEALDRIGPVAGALRAVEAHSEALHADLFQAELLLRAGQPEEAEPRLRAMLAAAPDDSDLQRNTAWILSEALEGLGRGEEAAALREAYGLGG